MTPVTPIIPNHEFPKSQLKVYAKDQPEYIPLPVHCTPSGIVTSRWKLTWRERLYILFFGHFWLQCMTFNRPLQPVRPIARTPKVVVTKQFDSENELVGLYELIEDV